MRLKTQDLKNMTKEELTLKLEALYKEIFSLTQEAKAGRVEKPHRLKEARRNIARCKTILREKELQGVKIEEGKA
jgi:large subunit ribosomal protein L29